MDWIDIILLFTLAFLPPIIYAIWIRNTEKYNRERWKPIAFCFLWGASIAIIAAVILEILLSIPIAISIENTSTIGLITAIIIAPFAEEITKPLALRTKTVKKELDEIEDGLIYGAVAGLGFSATENLLYGASFLEEGLMFFFIMMALRSFGGCLLHASATALTGYGYTMDIMNKTKMLHVLPYLLLAMGAHALYNFLVSFNNEIFMVGGLFIAFLFVTFTIIWVRKKIKTLDALNK